MALILKDFNMTNFKITDLVIFSDQINQNCFD